MSATLARDPAITLPATQTEWTRVYLEARNVVERWSDPVGLIASRPFQDLIVTALDRVDRLMNLDRNSPEIMQRVTDLTTTLLLAKELKETFGFSVRRKLTPIIKEFIAGAAELAVSRNAELDKFDHAPDRFERAAARFSRACKIIEKTDFPHA